MPLPTLRLPPHGSQRTARGETWFGYSFVSGTCTPYLVPVRLAHQTSARAFFLRGGATRVRPAISPRCHSAVIAPAHGDAISDWQHRLENYHSYDSFCRLNREAAEFGLSLVRQAAQEHREPGPGLRRVRAPALKSSAIEPCPLYLFAHALGISWTLARAIRLARSA